jgi:hypothetical protein
MPGCGRRDHAYPEGVVSVSPGPERTLLPWGGVVSSLKCYGRDGSVELWVRSTAGVGNAVSASRSNVVVCDRCDDVGGDVFDAESAFFSHECIAVCGAACDDVRLPLGQVGCTWSSLDDSGRGGCIDRPPDCCVDTERQVFRTFAFRAHVDLFNGRFSRLLSRVCCRPRFLSCVICIVCGSMAVEFS